MNALRAVITLAALAAMVHGCIRSEASPRRRNNESGPCAAIAARFLAARRAASGACTSNSECGCYNPVHGSLGCGGVTDRATSERLGAIEREFHAAGCPWPHQCAAQLCDPQCVEGQCR